MCLNSVLGPWDRPIIQDFVWFYQRCKYCYRLLSYRYSLAKHGAGRHQDQQSVSENSAGIAENIAEFSANKFVKM